MPTSNVIIDNVEGPNYAKSGGWNGFGGGYGGNDFHYQPCENGPGAWAEWTGDDMVAGVYTIRITWPSGGNRTDWATFIPYLDDVQAGAPVVINQINDPVGVDHDGVTWQDAFTGVEVQGGSTLKVRLEGNTIHGGQMIADAIELVKTGDLTPTDPATKLTLSGPSTIAMGSPVTFTVTPDDVATAGATLTPTGSAATGLSAQTLTFTSSGTPQTKSFTPTVEGDLIVTLTVETGGLDVEGSPVTVTVYDPSAELTGDIVRSIVLAALAEYQVPQIPDLIAASDLVVLNDVIDALQAENAILRDQIAAMDFAVKAGGITSASFANGTAVPLPTTPPAAYVAPNTAAIQAACTTALGATPVAIKSGGINSGSFAGGSAVPLPPTPPSGYGGGGLDSDQAAKLTKAADAADFITGSQLYGTVQAGSNASSVKVVLDGGITVATGQFNKTPNGSYTMSLWKQGTPNAAKSQSYRINTHTVASGVSTLTFATGDQLPAAPVAGDRVAIYGRYR